MLEKVFRANSMRWQPIYDKMPAPVRTALASARGWTLARNRYAADMYGLLRDLRQHETWSAEEILAFQLCSLRNLLAAARQQVPFYERIPQIRINHLEDWRQLPVLTRESLRSSHEELISRAIPASQRVIVATTGTTGAAVRVAYSSSVARRVWAFRMRQLAWIGIQPRDPRITLFGSRVVPQARSRPPYWVHNWPEHQLLMSSFHLSPAAAPDYIACLRRHEGWVLEGFPSVLGIVADLVLQRGESLKMRAVLTDGEPLYPFLRQKIEKAFQTRCYDSYGNTELCGLIQECERGRMHLAPEFAFLEILDEQDRPVQAGQEGYFVWSGFVNEVMPVIRYRIGDRGCWDVRSSCPCGRAFPQVLPTITRDSDLLHAADGRIYSPRMLNQLLKHASTFRFCQFVQDRPDHVYVRAVPGNGYARNDVEAVRLGLQKLLGPSMQVGSELADSPIVRAGGKIPLIVQQVQR